MLILQVGDTSFDMPEANVLIQVRNIFVTFIFCVLTADFHYFESTTMVLLCDSSRRQ